MQCCRYKCIYNKNGGCLIPNKIALDEYGTCVNMYISRQTLKERFDDLKIEAAVASNNFIRCRSQANHDAMFAAINTFNAFCSYIVERLLEDSPKLLDNMYIEDDV